MLGLGGVICISIREGNQQNNLLAMIMNGIAIALLQYKKFDYWKLFLKYNLFFNQSMISFI